MICAPGTENLPLSVNKTIPIEGRGILTMTFDPPVIFEDESFYFVNTMDWEFDAIPEPGTGALFAGSILLLWLRKMFRRSTGPMPQSRPSSFEAPAS